ncbi:MAG: hypothetical protein ABF805_05865 [Bifidobacterium sp.]
MTLFIVFPAVAIVLYDVNLYAPHILVATMSLVAAGLIAGALLPGILTTWLNILYTVASVAVLLFAEFSIPLFQRLLLLVVFPISADLMLIIRHALIKAGWTTFSRTSIERYIQHYHPVTKLQTSYNAEKMYAKVVHFIQNDHDETLWTNVTAVHWAHNAQYKQFHASNYDVILRKIAKVLKEDRLPSESLYYLDRGTFLIISHHLSDEQYEKRNEVTKSHLTKVKTMQALAQFKWGSVRIDRSNASKYQALSDVMKRLQREMETDLVVEYLKAEVVS